MANLTFILMIQGELLLCVFGKAGAHRQSLLPPVGHGGAGGRYIVGR